MRNNRRGRPRVDTNGTKWRLRKISPTVYFVLPFSRMVHIKPWHDLPGRAVYFMPVCTKRTIHFFIWMMWLFWSSALAKSFMDYKKNVSHLIGVPHSYKGVYDRTRVRSLAMLVTHWLTDWLTHSLTHCRLVNFWRKSCFVIGPESDHWECLPLTD